LPIGYFEILGTLRVGGIVAQGPDGSTLEHIYVADVFGKSDRSNEFSIDSSIFEATDWKAVGLARASITELCSYFEKAQAPLQSCWERRISSF